MHQGYIKGLDGLRAVAILWVMFGHISSSLNWPADNIILKPLNLLANMGWVGVQLFFVISGFLITQILIKDRGKPNYLKYFYMRRSLRIFPIYFLTLIFFFIIIPMSVGVPDWLGKSVDNQMWYWLYLQNWIRPFEHQGALAPLWSLAIEEQFYLVWPLLVLLLSNRWLKVLCLLMIISAPIIRTYLFHNMPLYFDIENIGKASAYNFTIARWDAIAIGSLLALLVKEQQTQLLLKLNKPALTVGGLVVAGQIVILSNFAAVEPGIGMLNQTTSAIMFGLLVILVSTSNENSFLIKTLEFKPIKSIGKVSYAMYLFHLPLTVVIFDYWRPLFTDLSALTTMAVVLSVYAVIVGLTYLLAQVSWHLFEHPILRYKDKFND